MGYTSLGSPRAGVGRGTDVTVVFTAVVAILLSGCVVRQ